ncbi:MAG: chromate efflux transporter [Chthoniobacterales bacterium]|jgi:chromate transporter
MPPSCQEKAAPPLEEVIRFFAWLGFVSFGGPAGQIAILREELVERRRWLTADEFSRGLNFCLLLPGPEAHQLAIYSGWKVCGLRGAVAAGALFVLPAAVLLWVLSALYASYGRLAWVESVFGLVRPAVLAIILAALARMAKHHLEGARAWFLAAAAFVAMFFFALPFPWIVLLSLGLGLLSQTAPPQALRHEVKPTPWRAVCIGLALWAAPIALAALVFGPSGILTSLGIFFSKVAVVTFGGAYAVLPYVADHAVASGWLSAGAMQDGLALAETTPGPLIIVLQFAGFFAGWTNPGQLPPIAIATLGAALTTWVTFLPSLIFILIGAPYVDRLAENPRARAMLGTVSAAVVGVIANLAAWFATGVFAPGQDRIAAAVTAGVALWLLSGRGWKVQSIVALAAGAGLLRGWWTA